MYYLPYNKDLKLFSRELRNNSTLAEVLLWNELKQEKMMGYQFNRQKPLDNFIVDFYCKPLRLVIEIDGCSHYFEEAFLNDIERQKELEKMKLKFLRFDDEEVRKDMMNVLRVIEGFIAQVESSFSPKRQERKSPLPPLASAKSLPHKGEFNHQFQFLTLNSKP